MWAIRGRIVAMSDQAAVAPSESAVFSGRVWIGDDGRIAAVTKSAKAGPPGSADATVVDVGSWLVVPGLIDLHNHLAYNTLPLWTEPEQRTPFVHHNPWTNADTYSASTTWPAYALLPSRAMSAIPILAEPAQQTWRNTLFSMIVGSQLQPIVAFGLLHTLIWHAPADQP